MVGYDTTASSLSACMHLLLRHPIYLAALRSELFRHYESTLEMTAESLAKLPLLNGCIQETLRLLPPANGKVIESERNLFLYCTAFAKAPSREPTAQVPERRSGEFSYLPASTCQLTCTLFRDHQNTGSILTTLSRKDGFPTTQLLTLPTITVAHTVHFCWARVPALEGMWPCRQCCW